MTKKPLAFTSIDELDKAAYLDPKMLDFNKPAICNSLLKIYDRANEYVKECDDERAYIMFMRFFEGFVQLRKSRIYKEDKHFVDNFITPAKLDQTMSRLERMKDELRKRYEQKSSSTVSKTKSNLKLIFNRFKFFDFIISP